MTNLTLLGEKAVAAKKELLHLNVKKKNEVLFACADALEKAYEQIITENEKDMKHGYEVKLSEGLLDRLLLNKVRVFSLAEGLRKVALQKDPIGRILSMEKNENGMMIGKRCVPLGVIGIIYESRPNVTSDAFGLCFKAGNAVILRGGSNAVNSILVIVKILRDALASCGVTRDAVQMIEDTDRDTVTAFMKLNQYVDVLIPRGGAGLIKSVVENSTIPVIETGTGNCHIYVDKAADFEKALNIIDNAKTQRLGVCNACESLVIHNEVLTQFFPMLVKRLTEKRIVIRADERARAVCPTCEEATEEDFETEYLDRLISVKTVDSLEEAIEHINYYNTGHSEAIITEDYASAMTFLDEIDAAAVYVNASTRFTDGEVFGLGAEIGISTQKLHVRGPMGVDALTSTKFVILGNGQIR